MVAPVAAARCAWFRDKTMTGSFTEDFLQYFVEEQCFLGGKKKKRKKNLVLEAQENKKAAYLAASG